MPWIRRSSPMRSRASASRRTSSRTPAGAGGPRPTARRRSLRPPSSARGPAYVALTPAVVGYAAAGLVEGAGGRVLRRNHLLAKLSHPDVARRFMSPAPGEILDALMARGLLTAGEAQLATRVPVAEDITI